MGHEAFVDEYTHDSRHGVEVRFGVGICGQEFAHGLRTGIPKAFHYLSFLIGKFFWFFFSHN